MVIKKKTLQELEDELPSHAYTHRLDLAPMPKFRNPEHGAMPDVEERLIKDELMLDGEQTSRAVLSAPLPVDPGRHELRIMRAGEVVAEANISLEEGAEESLRLEVPAPTRTHTVPGPEQAARDGVWPPVGPGLLDGEEGSAEGEGGGGVLRSPWLWVAVGLVVAGGVTAGVLLTRDSGQSAFAGNVPPGFLVVQ